MSERIAWTATMDSQLREFYFAGGYTSDAVGGLIGVSGKAVRARAARLRRGHPEIRIRKPGPTRAPKPKAEAKPPAPKPLDTSRAPVNFKVPEKPAAALSDRILSALRLRAMSAPSLASELNEKEMAVTLQLAAMAHAGEVQAGPALDRGPRHLVWRVTSAQYAQAVQTLAQEIAEAAAW